MDENQVLDMLLYIRLILLSLTTIGGCLYAIPLCFIRRFHKPNHLLTASVCIAVFNFSVFWLVFYVMNAYYPSIMWSVKSCIPISYIQNVVDCQVFYGLCMVSLNRLFTVLYKNKALFRSNKWAAICISAQWIFGALMPSPILASNMNDCLTVGPDLAYRTYLCVITIVLPSIIFVTTNSIIFSYARHSTRRIQPMNGDSAQAGGLTPRDRRLLKHMIFIYAVYICGWTPVYVIRAVNGTIVTFSVIAENIFLTIPVLTELINIIDLFVYNHELRKYLTNRRPMDQNTRIRERPKE